MNILKELINSSMNPCGFGNRELRAAVQYNVKKIKMVKFFGAACQNITNYQAKSVKKIDKCKKRAK